MTLYLGISTPGAEPYRIDDPEDLDAAIEAEATTIAADAGPAHLESPDQWARDELQEITVVDMTRALRGPGDTYSDPVGVTYYLYESDDQPQPKQEEALWRTA